LLVYGTRTIIFSFSDNRNYMLSSFYLHHVTRCCSTCWLWVELDDRLLWTARRARPLSLRSTLSYSGSWWPNLTNSECVRLIAHICSGPSSPGRQCVAEDFVTRIAGGPVIAQSPLSSYLFSQQAINYSHGTINSKLTCCAVGD